MADAEYDPADPGDAAEYDPTEAFFAYDPVAAAAEGDAAAEEARHFQVDGFSGRLGLGLASDLAITDIPDSSPCRAAGLPSGVRLTHVNGVRVETQQQVGEQLAALSAAGAGSIVLSVIPARADYAKEWWASVKGNVAGRRDEDEYDPMSTTLRVDPDAAHRRGSSPGSDDGAPGAKRRRQSSPWAAPAAAAAAPQARPPQPLPSGADGLHPCTRSGRTCGETCPYRMLPVDTCVHFCRGTCSYGDGCRWQHTRPHKAGSGFLPPDCKYECVSCDLALARSKDMVNHQRSLAHKTLAAASDQAASRAASVNNGVRSLISRLQG
eukprot:TRINITY_DN30082_c0_g1_i1.p1 TRINITY_DN30082_c0_g1~~TRINITY_DN30082_c0_g1_i1.p1  ORF type:complete len:323 (+),score=58.60 TRINITY_DN30082_c0_g1_i1:91-1059(+)